MHKYTACYLHLSLHKSKSRQNAGIFQILYSKMNNSKEIKLFTIFEVPLEAI